MEELRKIGTEPRVVRDYYKLPWIFERWYEKVLLFVLIISGWIRIGQWIYGWFH